MTTSEPLDMMRYFLPEALEGTSRFHAPTGDDRLWLNQIRACSYVHLFDLFERALVDAARVRALDDVDAREMLEPLLRYDTFDHHDLFAEFETTFTGSFAVQPRLVKTPESFELTLKHAVPLSLLLLALHLKLMTQQHYLACVRGHEDLEPHFVKLLKRHWTMECGPTRNGGAIREIQEALSRALPGRVPAALRDYRLLVFACDDVLRQEAELNVATLDEVRGSRFGNLDADDREAAVEAEALALRKTFLTLGIVNAAFVYAVRSLGPLAPTTLAGIVSALVARR